MFRKTPTLLSITFCILLLAIATINIYLQSPMGLLTTPDSLNYLDMAKNYDQGRGALVTNRTLQATVTGEDAWLEQRLWPKLYPIALSFFVDSSYSTEAVRPLSILLLTFLAILFFVIVKRFFTQTVAFIAAVLLMHTLPISTVYAYIWSETLFIPLFLLFSYATLRYAESTIDNRQSTIDGSCLWISMLSLSLLALAYTRYIGIGMVVVLFPLFLLRIKSFKNLLIFLSVFVVFSIAVGIMLYNNYQLTGSISGGIRQASSTSWLDNIQALLNILLVHFPSRQSNIAAFFIALISSVLFYRHIKPQAVVAASPLPAAIIFFMLGVLYIVLLLGLRSHSTFDDLDVRLVSPAFVLFYLTAILVWLASMQHMNTNKLYLIPASLALCLCLATAYQGYNLFHQTVDSLKENSRVQYPVYGGASYNNFTVADQHLLLKKTISQLLPANAVIAVNQRPAIIEMLVQRKTIALPEQINIMDLQQLNQLPEGSIVLLDNSQPNPLVNLAKHWRIQPSQSILTIDGFTLLALPIILQE